MDEKEYRSLILEILKETQILSKKLLETPLLFTENDLIALEYDLEMLDQYCKEFKEQRNVK